MKQSKKRAISTVLTTVIILVSSVVLGAGVILYGTSLFQSGTQTESISIDQTKLWVHSTSPDGLTWGASAIRNSGDKVVSVDQIKVRGQEIPFTQWYPDTAITPNLYQLELNHTGWVGVSGMLLEDDPDEICNDVTFTPNNSIQSDSDGAGGELPICANSASGPVALNPGQSAIIYFKLANGTITSLDSGISTTVSIFAGKAGGPQTITIGAK
ncbi:hypothetical protein [Nitrosopumilus sp.]|uniref:hypothetical protein n=1 Tax=Nitrosopumilus sp. TaxID=2024843 RepID=UPI00349FFED5